MNENINIVQKIIYNEPMKKHTSFKIGGNADLFVSVKNAQELKQALLFAKQKQIHITIIGNGTNILVSDNGIRGIVIKMDIQFFDLKEKNDYVEISVGSGNKMMALATQLKNQEISGFEQLSGIPGTIGGAIYMNAGAYGKEMKDIVISTKCMNMEGEIFELLNKEQKFEYRSSIFNNKEYIILETKLKLQKGKKEDIELQMKEYLNQRKEKQPLEYPSAGSTFKRKEGIITAKLIDECGLKGYKIGGAMISEKHAGFIVNTGDATAKDVLELIKYVKDKVYEETKIRIEEEIKVVE